MINTATIMGRLVRDPELRHTQSGKGVANFTVAVDKMKKEDGADFISCVAWDSTAEFVNTYFKKGSMIALTGRLSTRSYDDKAGNKRTLTEIIAINVSFCGSKSENAPTARKSVDVPVEDIDDEDLPF